MDPLNDTLPDPLIFCHACGIGRSFGEIDIIDGWLPVCHYCSCKAYPGVIKDEHSERLAEMRVVKSAWIQAQKNTLLGDFLPPWAWLDHCPAERRYGKSPQQHLLPEPLTYREFGFYVELTSLIIERAGDNGFSEAESKFLTDLKNHRHDFSPFLRPCDAATAILSHFYALGDSEYVAPQTPTPKDAGQEALGL